MSLYRDTSKLRVFPFLVLTRTSNKPAIAKLLVPRGRANTMRPHCSISSYIRSTCALWGFTCVFNIDTHAYEPSPSRSSWFSRVLQVGPYRRPDNGHYPLSNGVRNLFHTWDLPTRVLLFHVDISIVIFSWRYLGHSGDTVLVSNLQFGTKSGSK